MADVIDGSTSGGRRVISIGAFSAIEEIRAEPLRLIKMGMLRSTWCSVSATVGTIRPPTDMPSRDVSVDLSPSKT